MSDRGAKALALNMSRLSQADMFNLDEPFEQVAADILGSTGLFIADVTKHEPTYVERTYETILICACGWSRGPGESYFDHLTPDSTGAREP